MSADPFKAAKRWTAEEEALIGELRDRAETRAAARAFLRTLKKQGARLGVLALEALASALVAAAAAELARKADA